MTATDAETETKTDDHLIDEIRTWLEDNWDPDLTVAQWWERLGLAGWSAPGLPTNAYGHGLSRNDAVAVLPTPFAPSSRTAGNIRVSSSSSASTTRRA